MLKILSFKVDPAKISWIFISCVLIIVACFITSQWLKIKRQPTSSEARTSLCHLLMLTVAPFVVFTTMQYLEPNIKRYFFDSIALALIISIFYFLPTYLPTLWIIPVLMELLSQTKFFRKLKKAELILVSLEAGAVLGALVPLPLMIEALSAKQSRTAIHLTEAGALAGSVTLCLIALIYHHPENQKKIQADE